METKKRDAVGEKNGNATLNESSIREIRELLNIGMSAREIAEKYNVHKTTIGCIRRGKTWNFVE
jgi:IS30 family transposase